MHGLGDAAVCRSESDWLVGINGTRAMTAFNSKTGGFHLTTVGRVQTPTLAIVVERERKIREFQARPYWEVEATFAARAGEYAGKWYDEGFKGKSDDEHARADRLWEQARADAIRAATLGKPGTVSEESRPETRLSPLLFDLTSLQREANARFGFSAKTTLGLAQALYEKHKVLTYPRTDSRCLPEDYIGAVKATLAMLTGEGAGKGHDEVLLSRYAPFAHQIIARNWVHPNKRIFNNAKVSDHFAIIPTTQAPRHLNEAEQKLYDFVVRRFLSVFFPAAEYLVTTRITRVESFPFKTEGKVLVNPGWLAVHGKESQGDEANLVAVDHDEKVKTEDVAVKASETKPPPRYSEATLLSAMEGAGKMVDDEELKAAMAGRGLGTPATRAQIIENLIGEQYMHREGRELIPTAKAFNLMTLLNGLGVTELTQPELTGDWEWKLGRIEKGEFTREEFMREIAEMTRHIVERAKTYDSDTIPGDFGLLKAPCPRCGGLIRETYKKFQCSDCDYALWKIVAGRQYEPAEIETLLTDKRVGPLTGFRNKMGRAFAASIRLNDDLQPEFDFGQDRADADDEAEAVDFSGQEALGKCPKCGSGVFDNGTTYTCENAVGVARSCDFRSGKIILQQPVEPAQMQKLLAAGRTELLKGFVSNRTKRKFSAYLVVQDGKVGFEFEKKTPAKRPAAKNKADAAE
jgi:DNA topoisomerase-3